MQNIWPIPQPGQDTMAPREDVYVAFIGVAGADRSYVTFNVFGEVEKLVFFNLSKASSDGMAFPGRLAAKIDNPFTRKSLSEEDGHLIRISSNIIFANL